MFEQLQNQFSSILKTIKGHGKITEKNINDAMRDVRMALLEADVNFKVAKAFINRVQSKALGEAVFDTVTPGQQFIKLLLDELIDFLGNDSDEIKFKNKGPTVILIAGLQGSGKTTTTAKLASFLKNKKQRSPLMIAADLQRYAAVEQLKVLGEAINVPVFSINDSNPETVVQKGLKEAEKLNVDTILIDTAGRLHIDDKLMSQLIDLVDLSKPDEILYVADSMTGQDAVNSSKIFSKELDISGVILTKMDGDSRGGCALSIREITKKPIKYVGIGEKMDDIQVFHPDRLAKRILGMGDVVSLVEKAQETFDQESADKLQKKMLEDSFTLEDFQVQLKQFQKMGSISDIVGMLPGVPKMKNLNLDDNQLKWTDAIINSMTPKERQNPRIINGSRRKRIALGSGRNIQEVNNLLKQFSQMRMMMKKIKKNKGNMKFPFM